MASKPRTQIYDDPAYTATEAAHMLAVPLGTLKAWSYGQSYRQQDGVQRRFRALIEPADSKRRLLSFHNLCELHALAAIRRHYKVPMNAVRSGLSHLKREMQTARPLLDRDFMTDGLHLFIEHAGVMVNVSKDGQTFLSPEFERDLLRVQRDSHGTAIKLFPATRDTPVLADQPQFVVIDPTVAFGRPVLANAGVTTSVIQDRFLAGDSPKEMADDYRVDESDIWEALRFEQRLAA
jgi:uncharacterized protein (DUF433 family)